MKQPTHNPAAHYAEAIEYEKSAWHALQAEAPGSHNRAQAWAVWSEAISRTNQAWRQLSCQPVARPRLAIQPTDDARPFAPQPNAPPKPFKARWQNGSQ